MPATTHHEIGRVLASPQHHTLRFAAATFAALAVIAAAALAGSTVPARAAFPGRDGRIAFVLKGNIYSILPDGTGRIRLTSDGNSRNPRWSADGKMIAFNRGKDIYVMRANGSQTRRLTRTGQSFQPTWSPDGTRIAFVNVQPNGSGDLFWVAASGGALHRLTSDSATCGDSRPTWSPRGDLILYQCGGSIRTVNTTTRAERLITEDGQVDPQDQVADPDFAADGRHILFLAWCSAPGVCDGLFNSMNVMSTGLTGGLRTPLTDTCGCEGDPQYTAFAAAPDGSQLVFLVFSRDSPSTMQPGGVVGAVDPDWQPVS